MQELGGTPLSSGRQQASLAQRHVGIEPDALLDLPQLSYPLIPPLFPKSPSGLQAQELAVAAHQPWELHNEGPHGALLNGRHYWGNAIAKPCFFEYLGDQIPSFSPDGFVFMR